MQMLEHIHVNVRSIEATERFILAAMPDFKRRGGGLDEVYGKWLHLGAQSNYIALTEVAQAEPMTHLRHIGVQVSNIEALIARLAAIGFEPSDASSLESHPHRRRIYYVDANGLDWEFVQYLSEDTAERNDYSQ